MKFKQGVSVYTADGQDVGRIDRVVIDPLTKVVTDIVVRKGFLFTEDKVVPVSMIASATNDRVSLHPDVHDLDKVPPFEETYYLPLTDAEANAAAYPVGYAPPFYMYPPMGGWVGYSMNYPSYYAARAVETEQNIPDDTVALREGARVVSADGKDVGTVEQVSTETFADRAVSFVIAQGMVFKELKRIPMAWVSKIEEGEVHLNIRADMLEQVRAYQEE